MPVHLVMVAHAECQAFEEIMSESLPQRDFRHFRLSPNCSPPSLYSRPVERGSSPLCLPLFCNLLEK